MSKVDKLFLMGLLVLISLILNILILPFVICGMIYYINNKFFRGNMNHILKKGMETPQLLAYVFSLVFIFVINLLMASFFILIIDEFRKHFGIFSDMTNKIFWLGSFVVAVLIFIKLLNSKQLEITELKRKFILQTEVEALLFFIPLWLYVYNGKYIFFSIEPIILILYCLLFFTLLINIYILYKEAMLEEIILNIDSVEYAELKEGLILLHSKIDENKIGRINTVEIPWYFGRMVKYEIIEVKDTVDVKKLYLYESIDYKVNNKIGEVLSNQNKERS